MPPLSKEAFVGAANVSRETFERLAAYLDLLIRWQPRINLVAQSTLEDPWRRHFLDSAQLFPLVDLAPRIYDLGSGAGFPGLVLAIMGAADMHLIESDQRKAAFLREAARITGTKITLHATRAEKLSPKDAEFCTARALAPLDRLLALALPLLKPGGTCLFMKGKDVEAELTEASKAWSMQIDRFPSLSDESGCILRLKDVRRV